MYKMLGIEDKIYHSFSLNTNNTSIPISPPYYWRSPPSLSSLILPPYYLRSPPSLSPFILPPYHVRSPPSLSSLISPPCYSRYPRLFLPLYHHRIIRALPRLFLPLLQSKSRLVEHKSRCINLHIVEAYTKTDTTDSLN